jgi:arylsulfatase
VVALRRRDRHADRTKPADSGIVYSQWHTTALCSPTHLTFLTGRNHHLYGCSAITAAAVGFPGGHGRIPEECGTIGQILQDNGFSTFWLGTNHNVPEQDVAPVASRKEWPLAKGFDRFYGFLGVRPTSGIPTSSRTTGSSIRNIPEDGYRLSKDLAERRSA